MRRKRLTTVNPHLHTQQPIVFNVCYSNNASFKECQRIQGSSLRSCEANKIQNTNLKKNSPVFQLTIKSRDNQSQTVDNTFRLLLTFELQCTLQVYLWQQRSQTSQAQLKQLKQWAWLQPLPASAVGPDQ